MLACVWTVGVYQLSRGARDEIQGRHISASLFLDVPQLQVAQLRIQYLEQSTVERAIVSRQEAIICDLENKIEFQKMQMKRFEVPRSRGRGALGARAGRDVCVSSTSASHQLFSWLPLFLSLPCTFSYVLDCTSLSHPVLFHLLLYCLFVSEVHHLPALRFYPDSHTLFSCLPSPSPSLPPSRLQP